MIEVDSGLPSEQPLSRYLSLAKFLDLVRRRRIYFAALQHLGDWHEGGSTLLNMLFDTGLFEALDTLANYDMTASFGVNVSVDERAHLKAESAARRAKRRIVDTAFGQFDVTESNRYRAVMLGQRAWLDVSCWHRNQDESLAMWKVYGGGAESVCVISSVGALASSLLPPKEVKVYVLPVHYIDHRNELFQSDHLLAAAIHKQKPYSYENEIRAIAVLGSADILSAREDTGSYIDIKPATLIQAVRLSPKAPAWFRELIEQETSPFQIPILQSELDHDPIFGE
ncbi:MAG TPA: hypothetical protein VIK56_14170 [Rhodoferax sp.]